jgi:hypothetical protein
MSLPDGPDSTFPLVFFKKDLATVLRRSERTVERLDRAGLLPERLPLPGRPSWSRDTVLSWLSGGGPRRGRR